MTIDPNHLREILKSFKNQRLIVVGDVILDEYITGTASRLSPEAPVPVVDIKERRYALGGAGNVARNVIALGAKCSLFGARGPDLAGRMLHELGKDIPGGSWIASTDWTTPQKTRVIARGQQIVRLDREGPCSLDRPSTKQLAELVKEALPNCHGLIFSDYGKGLLTPHLVKQIMDEAAGCCVPVFVDPKEHFGMYRGCDLIKPNLLEAHCFTGASLITEVASRLQGYFGEQTAVAITGGSLGMAVYDGTGFPKDVPTVPQQMRDVQGAGDTAMAALALATCAGASLVEAAIIANAAAGVVVAKPGTATTTTQETSQALAGVIEVQRKGETDGA